MKKRGAWRLGVTAALLLAFAAWQLGAGGYIYLKAQLAQVLLERSWRQARAGATDARPWPWADTQAVMRLRVPRLGIEQIVLAGVSNRTLAFGPGFMLASNQPGKTGLTVLSGHRETHFAFLGRLRPGDELVLETPDGRTHRYRVSGHEVVNVNQTQLLLSGQQRDELVLITCYPLRRALTLGPERYLVFADKVESQPN